MITNAREYQITRAQLARLSSAVADAKARTPSKGVHPKIYGAELAALEAEVERLKGQLSAYEDLQEGRKVQFDTSSLEDLPNLLIQARIASRWSQKQVAERLGIHEQQVQRYEATRYRGVSFDRLLDIAKILGVHVEQKVVLAAPLLKNARAHLLGLGFSAEFIDARVLSNDLEREPDRKPAAAVPALERLRHIFGWTLEELAGPQPPRVTATAAGGALFKLPAGRKTSYLEAYTAYAFRLACGAARCAHALPALPIPSDWREARQQILAKGQMTLSRVIDWAWELGVVVLPLSDRAAFNGAFWRINGCNVVIMKQNTASLDRLMDDVLHEIYHASQEPERANRAVLDQADRPNATDPEEVAAAAFASDVLLNGRANALAKEVAREAGGYGPALKSATQRVAKRRGVAVGALANHLAWVLERQHEPINWWGTAHNLQEDAKADLAYARDVAFERLTPPIDDDLDVELLFRALRAQEAA